jgi:hypothetical protein
MPAGCQVPSFFWTDTMQKSVSILVAGATFISTALLMIVFSGPETERPSAPTLVRPFGTSTPATSSQTTQTRQMEVPTAAISPGPQLSESPEIQAASARERGGIVNSIPIPREFDIVSPDNNYWHRDTWRRLHGRLEQEAFDPSWSRAAEETLMRAINSNPEIARRGTPIVNCRKTICEMQMVVYENDYRDGKWDTYFNPVLKKMLDAGFKFEDFSTAHEGAATTIVFILSRKE